MIVRVRATLEWSGGRSTNTVTYLKDITHLLSQTHSHISNISCICQEIRDIKRRKPKSIDQTNNVTTQDEGDKTNWMSCQGYSLVLTGH